MKRSRIEIQDEIQELIDEAVNNLSKDDMDMFIKRTREMINDLDDEPSDKIKSKNDNVLDKKHLVNIKYIEKNSQDGYQYIEFDMYSEFAKWFIKNRSQIDILDISER